MNEIKDLLEEIKLCYQDNNIENGKRLLEILEKEITITREIDYYFTDLFYHFELNELYEKYLSEYKQYWQLAKWYMHNGLLEKVYEAIKLVEEKYYPKIAFVFRINQYFLENDYQSILNLTENILASDNTPIQSLIKSPITIDLTKADNPTENQIKAYNKHLFVFTLSSWQFQIIVVSALKLLKSNELNDFIVFWENNYPNTKEFIESRMGLRIAYNKFINDIANDKIIKLKNRVITNSKERTTPQDSIEKLIQWIETKGDFDLIINWNDPIYKEVKENYIKYAEDGKGFIEFEKIVKERLSKEINYVDKYEVWTLLDYYIMIKNFNEALNIIRYKKCYRRISFELFINLIKWTNNEFLFEEYMFYRYRFACEYIPFSKLVINTLDDFYNFVSNTNQFSQIKTIINNSFTVESNYYSSFTGSIQFNYPLIRKQSPYYISLGRKEIICYSYNPTIKSKKEILDLFNSLEAYYREDTGLYKRGISSDGEAVVYLHLRKYLKENEIILQYSPEWLKPQRVDLFIPSLNLAIEYQGRQHFEAIEYFGGQKTFEEQQIRDKIKKSLAEEKGVKLEYITYEEDIQERILEIKNKYFSE